MVSYWRFVQDYHISSIHGRGSRAVPSPLHLIARLPPPPGNSIRENFNSSDDRLHQIFPKTISPKIFPELSQKIFPAHAMNPRFAIFQKCRIAHFARIPASKPHLMQPTLKNENEKTALPFIPAEPSPSGKRSPVQKVLLADIYGPDSCRIQPNGRCIGDFSKQ